MAANFGNRQPNFVNHQQNNVHNETNNTTNQADNMAGNMQNANPTVNFSMGNINVPSNEGLSGQFNFYIPGRRPVIQYADTALQLGMHGCLQQAAWFCVNGVVVGFRRRILWWAQKTVDMATQTATQRYINRTLNNFGIKWFTYPEMPPFDWKPFLSNIAKAGICLAGAWLFYRIIRAGRECAQLMSMDLLANGFMQIQAAQVALEPQVYACPAELAADIQAEVFLKPRDTAAVDLALKKARKFAKDKNINPGATSALMAGAAAAAMTVQRDELEFIQYNSGPLLTGGHEVIQAYYNKFGQRNMRVGFFHALHNALKH